MRPLGLSDTIFHNLRDAQITAVAALDGPCDLPRLLAGIENVANTLPAFMETPVRLGVWAFARHGEPLDLARRVTVVRDPSVTEPAHLTPLLDGLRRNRLAGTQWRIVVLNPEPPPAAGALSAVFVQIRHGLADGTRIVQAMTRLDDADPSERHAALAAALPVLPAMDFPRDVSVHDSGLVTLTVPRTGMPRDGDASTRLAEAAAAAVADRRLYPALGSRTGNIGRTRFVLRRVSDRGAGNSIRMETVHPGAVPAEGHRRGLSRAQDLPLSQYAVAVAPPPLARLMMRIWYRSFDAIATLIPLPPRPRLGGRKVTHLFAAPPLWGPVPLAVIALAGRTDYCVSLFPGRGFGGDTGALTCAVAGYLNPGTQDSAASRAL